MNVTILGSTGAIGREITSQLIRSRALSRMEILQLATNPKNPDSRLCADGIRRDLQDAYAEINPELQVVENPEEFIGDIVVVAGGRTLPTNDFTGTRRDLLPFAKEVCDTYAGALVDSLTSRQVTPIFVIVTNPVEYVVQYFAHRFTARRADGARFVIGMGAHSDSLRFQWEIAHDLGVSRDRVSAEVVGEHGPLMIPRWSTVQIRGMPEQEQERCLTRLYKKDREAEAGDFDVLFAQRNSEIMDELRQLREGPPHAGERVDVLRMIERFRPDFRVILKPLAVHRSGSGTAHATGAAAASLIQGILKGEPIMPIVQRMVRAPGDAASIPFGVPTPLMELFRFSGAQVDDAWSWRERAFVPGSFRADRAADENRRIDKGIAAMRRQSAEWQGGIS
jgi:malate dehydrogenase